MSINALIVDGSESNRAMLVNMLTGIGVTCITCETGRKALMLGGKRQYNFIIVSRHLEDVSAELFLLRFQEHQHVDDTLTVMLTSEADEEGNNEAYKAGYKTVFNKDDIDGLQGVILEAVNNLTIDLHARILYVEDDRLLAQFVSSLLRRYRANVETVYDLSSAIALFQQQEFDLIITDYYLGNDETGDDLVSFVRGFEDSSKASVPVLVASTESNQSKRVSFLRNGASDYIIKPYDNDELIARASNLIAHKKLLEQFRQQQKELLKMAMSDQLTGLYNRRSLFDFGSKYISNAVRHENPVSMLVIDVDHFKEVNDTYGHAKGDVVLMKIGKVLRYSCRNEDFVARFGGEEFVMLLSHCGIADAMVKAERLRKSIELSRPDDLLVTVSIGVTEFTTGDDLDSLFARADAAVYKAKDLGRNRVEQYLSSEEYQAVSA